MEKYLYPIQTVGKGADFADGKRIFINDGRTPNEIGIPYIARIKTRRVISWIIYIFMGMYILLVIQTREIILKENMDFNYMSDASNWITAIATSIIAITAIISSYYYYKLFKASIAKDKPLIRAYIQKFKHPSQLPPRLFVKNEEGSIARNVTLQVGGRNFGSFSLKVNESQDLPVEVTDGLKIDNLIYEDIHGTKFTENNVLPIIIIADFGFR